MNGKFFVFTTIGAGPFVAGLHLLAHAVTYTNGAGHRYKCPHRNEAAALSWLHGFKQEALPCSNGHLGAPMIARAALDE
jgi:hypothetical protein